MTCTKSENAAKRLNTTGSNRNEDGFPADYDQDLCLNRIENEIGILKNSLADARMVSDSSFKSNFA